MESYKEKVLNALPQPKNLTELLVKINHLSQLPQDFKSRNDIMCSKCLTPWTLGKFSQKIIPSNHHRKRRRQFQIERLQKQIKSGESSKPDVVKQTRKLKRLQQQNNHVALYKCFCNSITRVNLRKATPTTELDMSTTTTTAEKEKKKDEQAAAVTNKLSMNKKEKKKKRKTAGLLIPPQKQLPTTTSTSSATTSSSKNIKLSQLSNILQKQKNSETIRQSKLNQFLK